MGVVILNHSELKLRLEAVDISCGMFSNNSALPPILEPGAAYTLVTEKVSMKSRQLCRHCRKCQQRQLKISHNLNLDFID